MAQGRSALTPANNYAVGYRVYFGYDGPEIVLLLIAGTKKTQQRDIQQAKAIWIDYKERNS